MNGKTASSNHSGEVSTQRSSSGAVRPRWATGPRIAVLLAAWFLLLAAILVLGAGTAVAAEAKEPSHCPRAEYEAALAEVDQAYSEVPRFPPPEGGSWPQEIYAEQLAQAFNAKVEEGFFEPRFKVRPGIDWSGCDLEGAELARADLAGADLSGANLEDAELGRANLEGANLTDAKLADAELAYASLSGAQLDGVSGEIEGRPASLPENWTLVGAYCRGYGVCLYYLAGPGADLYEAYLRGANLSGIDLAGADLERADLDFATLAGADLAGAELAGAEVVEVESGGIVGEPASLPDHWALRAGYLLGPGVWLRRAELAGADLHGIDLEHAHLEEAALKGSDLEGTDLEGADVESAELENANLQGANLQSAKLAAAEMAGADLAGADLAHARMEEVELERGTLEDANLTDATLEYAYLTGDDIAGADFSGAQLEGVTSGEELGTPASLPEPWRLVDGYLIGPRAELGLAHLTGAELAGADLEEANLAGASLQSADLSGADLAAAYLEGAALEGAVLRGADLEGALLDGANLTGGDLTGVNALATSWRNATCPDGKNAALHVAESCVEPLSKTPPPTVVTGTASSITASSAILNGSVNPNGDEITACEIEYGTEPSLAGAAKVSCGEPGSGTGAVAVSASASPLAASTTYYYRVTATNAGGRREGVVQAFTTGSSTSTPSAPTVVTGSASSITSSSATLSGSVNPNGAEVTACEIEYSTSPTLAGAMTVSCGSPGSGTSAVPVSGGVSGLAPLTVYYYRVDASNAGSRGEGSIESFTTLPDPPTVLTGSASSVTSSSATLNGTVNPNDANVTACEIEYATSPTLAGETTASCGSPGAGTSAVAVSAPAGVLAPLTRYYFRVDAANAGGRTQGGISTFTTPALPPTVVVGRASAITHTGATLTGSVNPNGSNVTACEFEYGTTLPSTKSVPCIPAPGAGSAAVAVTAAVTGLAPGTTYQYRLVAMNAGGTGTSNAASFKTAALEPPELGRCVSVAAGHGRFSSSKCSSEGGKGTYEWEPGAAKAHVSLSGGAVKLETATSKLITCTGSSGEGSYGAFKELTDVTLTFTGCQTTAGKCSSAGAAAGEVRASTLLGTLVWTSKASKQVAWELAPSAGVPVLEMQCATTAVEVSGSVLVPVKTDKAGVTSSLAFKASKGVQKPDEYEAAEGGTLKSAFEASFGAFIAEPIGLTTTLTLTGEEAIQISTTI